MCHNLGIWHNYFQVKLSSKESCWRTNCKTKCKLQSQNPLGNNRVSLTWERFPSTTREQSCQSRLGTIMPVSLVYNCASVTWEQLYQCHLGTIVPVLLGKSRTRVTWEQLCQPHEEKRVSVSLGNSRSSVTWEQSC